MFYFRSLKYEDFNVRFQTIRQHSIKSAESSPGIACARPVCSEMQSTCPVLFCLTLSFHVCMEHTDYLPIIMDE